MQKFLSPHPRLFRCLLAGVILLFSLPAWAQSRVVTGQVLSADDQQEFPGVNIVVKGTTQGTVTDSQGNYSIEITSDESVLIFSAIGYSTTEIVVGSQSIINVSLDIDVTSLSEVVVVGYGSVKKSDVTGALTRVSSEVIQERPVTNALQALQGKTAGVNVSTNMKPGEIPSVRIRGNRSINGTNDPLYVVDGIPLVSALGVSSFTLNDINPNDIESIEILKDASATAIYGSRGANGVILITTKKGNKGKVSVNYNSTVSLDSYHSLTQWMNGGEYIDRWRLTLMNGGLYNTATFTDRNTPIVMGYPDPNEDIARMGLAQDIHAQESVMMGYEWEDFVGGTVRTRPTTAEEQALGWPAEIPVYNSQNIRSYNWLEDAVRQGITQNHQLSLSAGNEISRIYISTGYFNQKGVQRDQDFSRFTTNISGDITANKWLTLGISTIASLSVQNFGIVANSGNTGSKDLYSRAADQAPYAIPKDDVGNWIRNPGGNLSLWNPLIDIDQSVNERRSASVLSSLFAEVKFTPWLKYRINFGGQYRNFRRGAWTGPLATSHLTNKPNTASYNTEEHFSWVVENLLFIDKTFNDHSFNLTLLQSAQKSRRENLGVSVSSTIYETSDWYDLASNTLGRPDSYGSGFTENALSSFMGRINYSWKNKYLLTASGRYDGASVLAPGHKWDFFPSFAVAWKLHDEGFMDGLLWINELKPRIGYGVTGSSSVSPYSTSGPLSRNPYVFGSTPAVGYLPQLARNPLLGWEKTKQWNIGVDFSLFSSRVSGSVEVYEANTSDLLMVKTIPGVSGYVEKWENIGKTRNKGLEITLSTVNVEKGDFTWTFDINWTTNKEEIVELINGKEDIINLNLFIGQPTSGVFYQLDNAGIWQNTAADLEEMAKFNAAPNNHRFYPGTIRVVDKNGDYRITGDDRVIRGTTRPKWTGGLTNTFTYKNWSLSALLYARVGQTYFGGYPNSYGGVWPNGRVENDMWSWDNPGGKWPMPNAGNVENRTESMQYHDGSFATIRHITLGYTLPQAWIQKLAIKDVHLSAQVLNPFIFGGDMVKMGINPDDDTNWSSSSSNGGPLGGMNNNTILQQSIVFGLRAGF